MRKWWSLTRVLIRNARTPFASGKHKRAKTLFFIVLMALAFFPLMLQIGTFTYRLIGALKPMGLEGMALAIGFSSVVTAVFIFGTLNVLAVFYFSEDLEALLALPIRPWIILLSKFTAAMTYDYFFVLLFLLPVLAAYGLRMVPGAAYIPFAAIVFLVIPVVPLAAACIVVMTLMRFSNFSRNRDRFGKIAGTVLMVFILGLNFFLQKKAGLSNSPEMISEMLASGRYPVLRGITASIPGTDFAVRAVSHCREFEGLVWMACFLCTAGMAVAVFLAVGERIYFRGVLGTAGRFLTAAAGRQSRSNPAIKRRAPFVSAWFRDMKILFRDPAFFMNCILTNFLWPVVLWLIVRSDSSGSASRAFVLLNQSRLGGVVYAGAMGVGMVLTAMNAIASTAISREGKHVFVMKIVPVSFGTQILAKAAAAMTMGAAGSLLLLSVAVIVFRLPAELIPGILVMLSVGIAFSGLSGVWLDLNFPKLIWDNSYKSVKQNLNVVVHILVNFLIAGLVFGMASHSKAFAISGLSILFAAGVCVDMALFLVLRGHGARLLERMDV